MTREDIWASEITRCGYEVSGMILLQAYLYTHSLLRGVTFEVLLLSSYALIPKMLPMLEKFFELQLWNSFQCCRHMCWMSSLFWNLRSFKADFIFGNRQKSFGVTSWWQCEFHFSNRFLGQKLLDRECLVSWSIVMVENPIVGPKFRPFSVHSFT